MLNAVQLRTAYQACDVFVSASNFETLGNTIIESICSGTPVAVQPEQGHLEYVVDGENSWFVNYTNSDEAKKKLTYIAGQVPLLPKCLPGLEPLGKRFRDSNFAQEFHDNVIVTATDAADRRLSSICRSVLEFSIVRPFCILVWFLIWLIMRVVTRLLYYFSTDVTFQMLPELGGSIETNDDGSVAGHFAPILTAKQRRVRYPSETVGSRGNSRNSSRRNSHSESKERATAQDDDFDTARKGSKSKDATAINGKHMRRRREKN